MGLIPHWLSKDEMVVEVPRDLDRLFVENFNVGDAIKQAAISAAALSQYGPEAEQQAVANLKKFVHSFLSHNPETAAQEAHLIEDDVILPLMTRISNTIRSDYKADPQTIELFINELEEQLRTDLHETAKRHDPDAVQKIEAMQHAEFISQRPI